jgi:hypothetical protein
MHAFIFGPIHLFEHTLIRKKNLVRTGILFPSIGSNPYEVWQQSYVLGVIDDGAKRTRSKIDETAGDVRF